MKANASAKANRTRSQIEAEVAKILAEAAEADAHEDELHGDRRGDELPDELADPTRRKAALDRALEALKKKQAEAQALEQQAEVRRLELEREAASRHVGVPGRPPRGSVTLQGLEAELARAVSDLQMRNARWREERADARRAGLPDPARPDRGRPTHIRRRIARLKASPPPVPVGLAPREELRVNTTDLDSKIMKSPGGWVQGYNAQAAVNEQGIVVSARVTTSHCDAEQCQPMMRATRHDLDEAGVVEEIGVMLFDAGYCSIENITAEGPERLIATTKSWKLRREARENGYATGDPPENAPPLKQMEHRLLTEQGMALYGLRQCLVEPAFGDMKENRGYRGFVRRGLKACDAEWKLICSAKNLTKLHRVTWRPA